MTALAAASRRLVRGAAGKKAVYAVGTSAVIYQGGLVALNVSTKRAVAASATTSRKLLGIATSTCTGVVGGTVLVEVEYGLEAAFAAGTGLTGGYAAGNVFVKDDNTVTYATGAGTAAVRVCVGELIQYEDSSNVWVAIRNDAVNTGLTSG